MSVLLAGAVLYGFVDAFRTRHIARPSQFLMYCGVLICVVTFALMELEQVGQPFLVWRLPMVLLSEVLIAAALITEDKCLVPEE